MREDRLHREVYPRIGQSLWIADIVENGAIVILNDGSKWRLDETANRTAVRNWVNLDVRVSRAKVGGGMYVLTTSSASVLVKYLGINEEDAV